MKKIYAILCIAIASLTQLQAQAPQGFNYQATVRNSGGDLIINSNVYFKFNLMQGSQTSLPIFSETHYVPTDDLGHVSLVIGEGTPQNNLAYFSEIDWSLGSYFLGIELSVNGTNDYVAMGTTQLLSVPYALYAENSGNSTPTTPSLGSVLAENNSANNQQIKDLQDPTEEQDAVTLAYVLQLESQIEEINLNIDHDGDGFTENQGDCDDSNASINPGATEIEDNIDNDCDGEVDEDLCGNGVLDSGEACDDGGLNDPANGCYECQFYEDADNDGFNSYFDCDDSDATINPNAAEILNNGIDENCDGEIGCLEDISGMYSVTTTYDFHDFLPDFYIYTQDMEIVDVGDGNYSVADFTGGLFSVGPYASNYNTTAQPLVFNENCGIISWSGQSDFWGAIIPLEGGENSVDSNGVVTISWKSAGYGEYGVSVYTPL